MNVLKPKITIERWSTNSGLFGSKKAHHPSDDILRLMFDVCLSLVDELSEAAWRMELIKVTFYQPKMSWKCEPRFLIIWRWNSNKIEMRPESSEIPWPPPKDSHKELVKALAHHIRQNLCNYADSLQEDADSIKALISEQVSDNT